MSREPSKQAAYEARQLEKGLIRVMTWIPAKDRDALRKYAAKKRKAFLKD